MSTTDSDLFETMIRVENKDIFIDLKKNTNGTFLKITERKNGSRNTILIPASGIARLKEALEQVLAVSAPAGKPTSTREPKVRVAADPNVPVNSIYVSGLPWETTEEELVQHFAQIGTVVKGVILRQKGRRGQPDRSMGCGVVEYASTKDAATAIARFHESTFGGRELRCREDRAEAPKVAAVAPTTEKAAAAPAKREKVAPEDRVKDPKRIFAGNLPQSVTQESLTEFFSGVGDIKAFSIKGSGRRRGSGGKSAQIEFESDDSAARAIAELNGTDFDGNAVIIREFYID